MASGRVSSVTADPESPFAAVYNPALLPLAEGPVFQFGSSLNYSAFDPIADIRASDTRFATDTTPAALTSYAPPATQLGNWSVGFAYPFSTGRWGARRAGFGLAASGPFNKLRTFVASTPYDFFSLRYGTSDAQFKSTLSAGLEVVPGTFSVGAGLSLYLSAAGNADATLTGTNPTSRLAFDVGLNTALLAGFFLRAGATSGSLVLRQKVDPGFEQSILGRVQWGSSDVVTQPFKVRTTLYYEPTSLETDWQRSFGSTTLAAGLSYQFWQGYQPPFLITEATTSSGEIRTTETPALPTRNTLSPRLSLLQKLGEKWRIAAGYQFRPTPIVDLSGPTNVLDTDTHVLGLALEQEVPASNWFPLDFSWGVSGQLHLFETRDVHKQAANTLGSPGYQIRGHAYTLGVQLSTRL